MAESGLRGRELASILHPWRPPDSSSGIRTAACRCCCCSEGRAVRQFLRSRRCARDHLALPFLLLALSCGLAALGASLLTFALAVDGHPPSDARSKHPRHQVRPKLRRAAKRRAKRHEMYVAFPSPFKLPPRGSLLWARTHSSWARGHVTDFRDKFRGYHVRATSLPDL